ncbi:MAG: SDR family oxidoreductase [Thermoleophilaceae bacterium]
MGAIDRSPIAVAGATGTVGSLLVKRLVAEGQAVRALVRDSDRARQILDSGVELESCDLADPQTLRPALEGVEKAFLLTGDIPPADDKLELEANFIDAAAAAGVGHIVYLSVSPSDLEPEFAFRQWHGRSERRLEESGVAWTHLRPIAFMSNLLLSLDAIRSQGAFHLPTGDGRVSVIAPEDLAEVAARTLTEEGHAGSAYTLTGPEALSYREQAAQLSHALGREIRFVDVPEQAAREAMSGALPAELTEALLEFYRMVKDGERELLSDDFKKVAGRAPRSFSTWADQHAEAFD